MSCSNVVSRGILTASFVLCNTQAILADDLPPPARDQSRTDDYSLIIKEPDTSQPEKDRKRPYRWDERRSVRMSEPEFNPFGRIMINGERACTGTLSKLEDYSVTEPGTLVTTTAHCFNHVAEKVLSGDTSDIEFSFNYIDLAGEQVFEILKNPEIWINNGYRLGSQYDVYKPAYKDAALLFFPDFQLPAKIQPINTKIFDLYNTDDNSTPLDYMNEDVIASGFSHDMRGLSTHEFCNITSMRIISNYTYTINTDCLISNGGSGSSLINRNKTQTPEAIGVASEFYIKDGTFTSIYAFYRHFDLQDRNHGPSFLKWDHQPETICAQITSNGLNVRQGPSTNDAVLPVILRKTDEVHVIYNDAGKIGFNDEWVQIKRDGASDGYVAAWLLQEQECIRPPPTRQ